MRHSIDAVRWHNFIGWTCCVASHEFFDWCCEGHAIDFVTIFLGKRFVFSEALGGIMSCINHGSSTIAHALVKDFSEELPDFAV